MKKCCAKCSNLDRHWTHEYTVFFCNAPTPEWVEPLTIHDIYSRLITNPREQGHNCNAFTKEVIKR